MGYAKFNIEKSKSVFDISKHIIEVFEKNKDEIDAVLFSNTMTDKKEIKFSIYFNNKKMFGINLNNEYSNKSRNLYPFNVMVPKEKENSDGKLIRSWYSERFTNTLEEAVLFISIIIFEKLHEEFTECDIKIKTN